MAVAEKAITVSGSVGAADAGLMVTVTESGVQTDATAADASVFGVATADASGAFTVSGARVRADGSDGLYGQFTAVVAGAAVGGAHYATTLGFASANSSAYPLVPDKKGVQVQMTDDAEKLGVKHDAVNVDLGAIMLNKRTSPDNIAFTSGGSTYYFDQTEVGKIDSQVKPMSDDGAIVNLILLAYRHKGDANSAVSEIGDPNASSAPGSGPIVGFNTRTVEGVKYFTAAMEFIASRYSRTDQKYGQAVGYIVGNEVDAQWAWSNSGDVSISEFLNNYSRALRIVSLATRKYFAASRTYTSLDHNWTVLSGPNPDPSNPTRYYTSKQIVDGLNQISKASGDFPWFVAFHPYPQNLFDPAFWNDTEATDSVESPLITFKNIQELPQYLSQPSLEFNGQPRRIILSEEGCNTPGNGNAMTPAAEQLQAACYAYAYYKIRFTPDIDSFIIERHVDNQGEGGLNLGLWSADYSTKTAGAPYQQKYIYNVFKYIDTSRSLQVTDFAKKIIGIASWKDVIPNFDPAQLDQRPITETPGTNVDGFVLGTHSLGKFTAGADGWTSSDNVSDVAVSDGALQATTQPGTFASQYRGVVKSFGSDGPRMFGNWVTAKVSIPVSTALGADTAVELRAALTSGQTVAGDARIPADGKFHTVALRIPWQWNARLTRLQVWVRGTGPGQPQSTFAVKSISTALLAGPSRRANVLLSATTSSAELAGSTLTVSLTNLDAYKLRGHISVPVGCGDFTVQQASESIPTTDSGASSTVDFTVTSATATPTSLCVSVNGTTFALPVTVPPPVDNIIYGFNSGTDGWVAGANVSSVAEVSKMLNGPKLPKEGTGMLQALTPPALATTVHEISVTPATPIDLAKAKFVHVWADSFGGAPGATGYTATFTLTGTDGTTKTLTDTGFTHDAWNDLSIDVSSWAGRGSVKSMTVTFAAVGSTYPTWNPNFQIDGVGYFTS